MQTPLLVTLLPVPCKVSKESWWDARQSGGIIVEQATHFVDMMRYLGGEIERDSIQAAVVGQDYPLSEMCNPGGELGVGTGCKTQDPRDTEGLSQYGRCHAYQGHQAEITVPGLRLAGSTPAIRQRPGSCTRTKEYTLSGPATGLMPAPRVPRARQSAEGIKVGSLASPGGLLHATPHHLVLSCGTAIAAWHSAHLPGQAACSQIPAGALIPAGGVCRASLRSVH